MMLKVSHKCKLLWLQFTMHLKQLFFIIKANNMHINLLCSLNQYCSLKDMTSGQLFLNIDSIDICITVSAPYLYTSTIHALLREPLTLWVLMKWDKETETSQNEHMGWISEYSRAESPWRDNVQALRQRNGDIPECTHGMDDLSIAEQSLYGEITSRPFISKRH